MYEFAAAGTILKGYNNYALKSLIDMCNMATDGKFNEWNGLISTQVGMDKKEIDKISGQFEKKENKTVNKDNSIKESMKAFILIMKIFLILFYIFYNLMLLLFQLIKLKDIIIFFLRKNILVIKDFSLMKLKKLIYFDINIL